MLQNLKNIQADPLFILWSDFQKDQRAEKHNLGIGIYGDDHGQSYVMPSVQKAAKETGTKNFDYISMSGNQSFLEATAKLILKQSYNPKETALQQTCGGTHALRVAGDLGQKNGYEHALFPIPTWPNHLKLFDQYEHHFFNHLKNNTPDLDSYLKAIEQSKEKSLLVLQGGSTHNPTGLGLTEDQIKSLIPLLKKHNIGVCIDCAYLGLGTSLEEDSKMVQTLWNELEDICVAVSFSKNMCLYRQRTGALLVKTNQKEVVTGHMQVHIRETISNPPAYGGEIADVILNNYFDQWSRELSDMKDSINKRRKTFLSLLPEEFQYLTKTQGMFGILPLNEKQIEFLKEKEGIYLPKDARINFSGLEKDAIDTIAQKLKKL